MEKSSKLKNVEIVPLGKVPPAALEDFKVLGAKETPRRPKAARPQTKVRVLVVDDDPMVADTSARVLDVFGYECYAAYNPADALACAESFAPDVVLSDVMMPGMNGVELCMEIKRLLPQSRILLFSGQVSLAHSLMEDANRKGYDFELLAKPLRPDDLAAKIGSLFGGAYSPANVPLAIPAR